MTNGMMRGGARGNQTPQRDQLKMRDGSEMPEDSSAATAGTDAGPEAILRIEGVGKTKRRRPGGEEGTAVSLSRRDLGGGVIPAQFELCGGEV